MQSVCLDSQNLIEMVVLNEFHENPLNSKYGHLVVLLRKQ